MRAREEERYVRFVQERHAGLYRTAFLLTGNHHTAQDAVQSTLVKVYTSWKRVRRADRPVAYVHRMLANEVASMHRRRAAGEVPTERPQDLPGARSPGRTRGAAGGGTDPVARVAERSVSGSGRWWCCATTPTCPRPRSPTRWG